MSDDEFLTALFGELPQTPGDPPASAIAAKKVIGYLPISEEAQREADEWRQAVIDNKRRRDAMTQAERDAEDTEWEARRAREKAERTCPHCGCDPDEHGSD